MVEKWIVIITLIMSLVMFIWGKWRYDLVALLAWLVVSITGILTPEESFSGFGNSAVITVAAILIVSRGLMNSGVVDIITKRILRVGKNPTLQVAILTSLVIFFSAFMNDIGALALIMPVAIQFAIKTGQHISRLLMPLAFGSLIGGMLTLIGTPPNIIISSYRKSAGGEPFRLFDFLPVGIGVAIAGLLFMSFIGWRLIPIRKAQSSSPHLFQVEDYLTEVTIEDHSTLIDLHMKDIQQVTKSEVRVVGILRGNIQIPAPSPYERLRQSDILILLANSEDLKSFLTINGVKLVPHVKVEEKELASNDISLLEAVVEQGSMMEGRTVREMNMRWRYGLNLLGISRRSERLTSRLGGVKFRAGDVLLLQGPNETIHESLNELSCLPLAEREIQLGTPKRLLLCLTIFIIAIMLIIFEVVNVGVAFIAAAVLMTMVGVMTLKEAYRAIEWPIIILLGAMIPLGTALEKTGGDALIAQSILHLTGNFPPEAMVLIILITTTLLTNIINNAAAAVLMAPIALQLATGLGLSIDPFLMAVTIGCSSAFLTPIGHQSNLLVMSHGGYLFKDYWRLGLPLSIIVIAVAYPLILLVWPL
ncbi:MAG: SLC13 family permease [Bacilli bacterium]